MLDVAQVIASDLMEDDLMVLHAEDTIDTAVAAFEEYGITAAPVKDANDELVGVLSASDVARTRHIRDGELVTCHGFYRDDPLDADTGEHRGFSREDYDSEVLSRERVKDWMNPNIIALRPTASIKEVCEVMGRERIHRVFVVENKSLKGVVSSFDIVNFIAGAE